MNSLTDPTINDQIVARINQLTPDTKATWGKMTVNQMLCHVADPFRDILGHRPSKPSVPAILRPLAKMLLLSKKPFGRNLRTLQAYLQDDKGGGTKPTEFNTDRKSLLDFIEQFSQTDANHKFSPHAGVGVLNREENGKLMWKHLDHHLRQFGV